MKPLRLERIPVKPWYSRLFCTHDFVHLEGNWYESVLKCTRCGAKILVDVER